jgi:guanylate kinase
MPEYKIALIGHSGAGKSECLQRLGGDPARAEMDKVLGTGKPPTIQQALEWIMCMPQHQDIVVFGVHIDTLNEIARAKARKDDNVLLAQVRFVYLRNEDRRSYEERLQGDSDRSEDNIRSALRDYESLNSLFSRVADHTIDTAYKDIAEVVKEILAYRAKLT